MSLSGTENIEVLRPALLFLRQAFRYQYIPQDSPAFLAERRNLGEAILAGRLLPKLREFNPEHSIEELHQAAHDLAAPTHANLPALQQALHEKMLMGSRVLPGAARDKAQAPVRYFDFENPDQNDFLIVERFAFAGAEGVRTLDAVIFVNGIPLAVLEARAVHEIEGLHRGLAQLQMLQSSHEISRLFHTIHFLVVLQKNAAVYSAGGVEDGNTWEDCSPLGWDDLRSRLRQMPDRENDLPTAQDILLAGMFAPPNLLELFRHYTTFASSAHGSNKMLAWCHQFQSVQAACARLARSAEPAMLHSASGAIVHPAGTGKSLSLFWLAGKLRQEERPARFPLLVLTERPELIELFKSAWPARRWPLFDLPANAALDQRPQQASGDTFLTSLTQFRQALVPQKRHGGILSPLAETPLLVLVDEVQRSGYEEYAVDLERAFPRAAIVAFTSFPAAAKIRLQSSCLQNVIHLYPHRQAEREGRLLPVMLEMRLPEWHIEAAAANLHGANAPGGQPQKTAKSVLQTAGNEIRLHAIVEDIFLHFNQDIAPNGNQAVFAAADAALAARYLALLAEKLPGQVVALLPEPESAPQPGQQNPRPEQRLPQNAEKILHQFAASGAPALLIVAAPLPAHFSAPKVQVVYFDRPMPGYAIWKARGLAQRASNANKTFGVLVDYWGGCHHLCALGSDPEQAESSGAITLRYAESQFEELRWWRRALLALFDDPPERERSEPWVLALATEEKRAAFVKVWRAFTRRLDQLLPQILHETVWQEACWCDQIRREAAAFYFDNTLAAAAASQKLNRLFEEQARVRGPAKIRDAVSLYGQEFWQELETFETLAAKILRLLHVLYREIRGAAPADPGYYQALEQRVRRIEIEHRLGRLAEATAFIQLRDEAMHLRVDQGERSPATHALAFMGILQRFWAPEEGNAAAPPALQEKLANDLLVALAPETALVDWAKKEDVQREMRRKIKQLLRQSRCRHEVQELLTQELMKLARARLAGDRAALPPG